MTNSRSKQSTMNGGNKQPDTIRRPSFGRNLLSSLGHSFRGIHQDDTMLSSSPTIGNLAKYTDDHRSNGILQDISNSDDDEEEEEDENNVDQQEREDQEREEREEQEREEHEEDEQEVEEEEVEEEDKDEEEKEEDDEDDDANLYEDAQFVDSHQYTNGNNISNANTVNGNSKSKHNTNKSASKNNNKNKSTNRKIINNSNHNNHTLNSININGLNGMDDDKYGNARNENSLNNQPNLSNITKDGLRNKKNHSNNELSRKDTIIGNIPNIPFSFGRSSQDSDLPPILDLETEVDHFNNSTKPKNPTNSASLKSSKSHDSPNDSQCTTESQNNCNEATVLEHREQNNASMVTDSNLTSNITGIDKDGFFSIRLTPLIDHSSSISGLYFSPIIRKIKPNNNVSIGRYTEKNKAAAHAPQGSSAPIVFKSKVVSRTHALFQCNDIGQWFLKDCKSSSGTFLNHIRLSPASQESSLMPLIDGDIIQLGMDYRGGTEEVYRCVKMRCEFNKSWQRKVNQFNLEIHKKLKSLQISDNGIVQNNSSSFKDELSECVICLLKIDPCQALFMSPCSHAWHYKCIRPIIIKSYPQFYCPNCRTMCDLETDIEDD